MKMTKEFKEHLADVVKRINEFDDYKRKIERDFQLEIVDILKKIDATSEEKRLFLMKIIERGFPHHYSLMILLIHQSIKFG